MVVIVRDEHLALRVAPKPIDISQNSTGCRYGYTWHQSYKRVDHGVYGGWSSNLPDDGIENIPKHQITRQVHNTAIRVANRHGCCGNTRSTLHCPQIPSDPCHDPRGSDPQEVELHLFMEIDIPRAIPTQPDWLEHIGRKCTNSCRNSCADRPAGACSSDGSYFAVVAHDAYPTRESVCNQHLSIAIHPDIVRACQC